MNFESVLLFLMVFLLIVLVIFSIVNARYFKRNENKYNELLTEYRQRGLDLDSVTKFATYFGSLVIYQKIIWFVRLYKGVKMKYTNDRYVQPEAYQFIQSLPEEKIAWILKLHRLYMIQFALMTLWFAVLATIWIFYK
ncbi:hypothetical protein NLT11_002944 [Cronobacter sakazakii]|uniref:Uncharacterized protein n=3 Tax=Cronobacter sakazakii TaxID=28141 RepID=A7MQ24_CROS8|nr:hypothetical protein [Cronobacter sakazakii]EGL72530.1 hypothetical protein CSE899_11412 [Cronobacter sakazakii E899]MDK1225011.1 hypothetical protein [Cronobacter turicensis]ABU79115.1 hypothetical protein ESA_03929 [Cronobacter sakazakii ATCC BAA-894]AGE88200.1 hypothetical protein CSSP291_18185 [Cronobacter sakazakii SP291]ALB52341.1 hypothetical protein AFK64_17920 [Cronobacter sakazakii]